MENEEKNKSSIVFIVELFMMFAIMLLVIVVITQTLVTTRGQSLKAKYLTEAVIAAENTAEVTHAASDTDDAVSLLEKMENASDVSASGDDIDLKLSYDGREYAVTVTMDNEKGGTGNFTASTIKVSSADTNEELYVLNTGSYKKNDKDKEAGE